MEGGQTKVGLKKKSPTLMEEMMGELSEPPETDPGKKMRLMEGQGAKGDSPQNSYLFIKKNEENPRKVDMKKKEENQRKADLKKEEENQRKADMKKKEENQRKADMKKEEENQRKADMKKKEENQRKADMKKKEENQRKADPDKTKGKHTTVMEGQKTKDPVKNKDNLSLMIEKMEENQTKTDLVEDTDKHTTMIEDQETKKEQQITESDIIFDRLYKTNKQVSEKVLSDILKILYSQKYLGSQRGHMSIQDFCKIKMKWNSERIGKKFEQFKEYLAVDLMEMNVIIPSFAYYVILHLCTNGFERLTNDSKNHIKYLKNYNKKVCLKYGLTGEDLQAELGYLEKLVEFIHKDVKNEFGIEPVNNMEIIRGILRSTNIPSSDPTLSFQSDEVTMKLLFLQKHLKMKYSKFDIRNPYVIINNTLNKHSECATGVAGKDKAYFPLKDGLEAAGKHIGLDDLMNISEDLNEGFVYIPPMVILNGPFGCGKSTLCHHLISSWYSNTGNYTRMFDLVFYIDGSKAGSLLLKEYMKEKLLDECSYDEGSIFTFLKEVDVLWILDGFHELEDPKSFGIVKEVLQQFSKHRILLTTRTYNEGVMKVVMEHNVHNRSRYLSILDDTDQKKIVRRVIKDQLKNDQAEMKVKQFIKDHYESDRSIVDFLCTPATLSLYTAFWLDKAQGRKNITTAGQLYDEIHTFAIEKTQGCNNKCSNDVISKFGIVVGQVAWILLKKGNHMLNEEAKHKIQTYLKEVGLDVSVMKAIFTCIADDKTEQYSFISQVQQSYFASLYITDMAQKDDKFLKELQSHGINGREYPEVLMCTLGLLCGRECSSNLILQVLNMMQDIDCHPVTFPYWWNVCKESSEHPEVIKIITELLPIIWDLNNMNCVAGLKLLAATKIRLNSIQVNIGNNLDPYKIPQFLQTMKCLPTALGDPSRNPIDIALHFWNHDEIGCGKPSDELIETLPPWGRIVNLTGELGGLRNPRLFEKIRTIRVRVSSKEALVALNANITRCRLLRNIRLTIGLPWSSNPSTLPPLTCSNVELNLNLMDRNNKKWVVDVLKKLGERKGLWRVSISKFKLTYEETLEIMKELSSLISDKLTLGMVEDLSEEQKKTLQGIAKFVLNIM